MVLLAVSVLLAAGIWYYWMRIVVFQIPIEVPPSCYLAGIDATSNTLAGSCYGVPVQGTMSHSWVMAFEDELESFLAYSTVWSGCPVLLTISLS